MPELPEVETVRRSLTSVFPRKVESVYLSRLAPVETTTVQAVRAAMTQVHLVGLQRWGKYLLFDAESGCSLVLHLGMSGRLFFYDESIPVRDKHTHMELQFVDGSLLRFIDARRFGTISLSNGQRDDNAFLERLGPDYLDPQLDHALFIQQCRRHPKLTLKMMLLNQGIAAGLGNIYACEALYLARLDPRRRVQDVSDVELIRLLESAQQILQLGVKHGGTTFRDYLDGRGHRGKMKEFLQVYDREGQSTLDGKGQVERIVQQQRATFFCPKMQK